MDQNNLRRLTELRPKNFGGHVGLLLDMAPALGMRDVPDPYYGGPDGFERILDLIEPASEALLARVAQATQVE
jgi:protein-tyrosine phosphatase